VHRNLPGWEQDAVVLPLRSGERLLGFLVAEAWGGRPLPDEHLQWLRALAGALALALEYEAVAARVDTAVRRAELAAEAAKAAASLGTEAVCRVLWAQAQEVLSARRMAVWEADAVSGDLKCVFAADASNPRRVRPKGQERRRAEEALRGRRAVFAEQGGLTLACLPMGVEGNPLGVLCVTGPGAFDELDRLFLDVLAASAGATIERDRQTGRRCEAARRELFAQFVRTVNHHVNNCLQAMMANAHLLSKDLMNGGPCPAARLDALLEGCYRLADFTERLRRTTDITTVETAGGEVLELAPAEDGSR